MRAADAAALEHGRHATLVDAGRDRGGPRRPATPRRAPTAAGSWWWPARATTVPTAGWRPRCSAGAGRRVAGGRGAGRRRPGALPRVRPGRSTPPTARGSAAATTRPGVPPGPRSWPSTSPRASTATPARPRGAVRADVDRDLRRAQARAAPRRRCPPGRPGRGGRHRRSPCRAPGAAGRGRRRGRAAAAPGPAAPTSGRTPWPWWPARRAWRGRPSSRPRRHAGRGRAWSAWPSPGATRRRPGRRGGAPCACPSDGWAAAVLEGHGRAAALVVGPGLGRAEATAARSATVVAARRRPRWWSTPTGCAALGDVEIGASGSDRPASRASAVLTPHDGEYARLAGRPRAPTASPPPVPGRRRPGPWSCSRVHSRRWPTRAGDARCSWPRPAARRWPPQARGDVLVGRHRRLLARGLGRARGGGPRRPRPRPGGRLGPAEGLVAADLPDLVAQVLAGAGRRRTETALDADGAPVSVPAADDDPVSMAQGRSRPAWAEIDLAAVRHNAAGAGPPGRARPRCARWSRPTATGTADRRGGPGRAGGRGQRPGRGPGRRGCRAAPSTASARRSSLLTERGGRGGRRPRGLRPDARRCTPHEGARGLRRRRRAAGADASAST